MKKYLQKLDTLGLVLLVAAAIWYSVSNVWEKWNVGLVIAGGVLLIVGIAANYRQIVNSIGRRSTKYAGNYVISIILVIAIVAGLNYIGQRHTKRFDMTGGSRFSLAPQTIKILKNLGKDVDIKAFFPGGESAELKELLIEYRTASARVHYEFIDPDRQNEIAKQYGVTEYGTAQNPLNGQTIKFGTIIVSFGNKREKIEKRSEHVQEQDLTNAIVKAGRTESKKIYFIQGHGEKDISDTERTGYSEMKKALEAQGYSVDSVNLVSSGGVPADAKVLIEAGPKKDPFSQELQFINDFLNKGGSLFVMVDPRAPSLETLLKPWGVRIDNDIVLDASGYGQLMGAGPSIPLVQKYEPHKITERFNEMTFFPFTRSVDKASDAPSNVTVESLLKTHPKSWGETDFSSQQASFDPAKDLKGPLSLAVAATKEIKASSDAGSSQKGRIVVVGTSNFPVNSYFPEAGNGNLFLNMVSWLAQDEDLISIRPREQEDRRILLSQQQLAMIRLFVLFVLPGIALVVGVMVFVNRRRM